MGAIRVTGILAARRLPDRSSPTNSSTPLPSFDTLRLVAILTAAAAEEMESDEIYLTSIVELPEPGGSKHWPRVGKMRFFHKTQHRH